MVDGSKYRVEGELGRGAFGVVYLAYQPSLDRRVAIKQLSGELAADPAYLDAFRQEAQVMAYLDHPNCVRVFELEESQGRLLLVTEYVPGASLRKVMQEVGRLTPQQALAVLKGSLLGLGHAHSLGLTHRDLKPENILADVEGVSKLADFGQAARGGTAAAAGLSGSPAYMSPEQVRMEALDHRSDLYSAGVVLYEFLAGTRPFSADSAVALMRKQVEEEAPRITQANPDLPRAADAMLARALAKNPDARYQGAEEFLAALEEVAVSGYGREWEASGSIKVAVGAAAAVAAAGVVGAAAATGAAASGAAGVAGAAATGTAATGSAAVATASTGTAVAGGGGAAAGGITLTSAPVVIGAGVVAAAGAAVVAYVVITSAIFGKNLIVDGNAEGVAGATADNQVVAAPGWKSTGGFTVVQYGSSQFFPGPNDPGPPDRGQNFFAGGQAARSTATQTIDLSTGGGGIDGGQKTFALSGWLGGTGQQGDNAAVLVSFEDATGHQLLNAQIGPALPLSRRNITGLVFSQTKGTVPRGARRAVVTIVMNRTDGAYNDGYADDLSLVIQ